ncbi:MAG: HAD-IA family hydrolase [Chloroflexota bacterium]|nr:HAD-IA family hydrolase [Chloroflexota bacterium]
MQRLDAVLFDAFGTLFAPVSAGSPVAHLCRLMASDGVRVPPESAERAIIAEVALYRERFPLIRGKEELCRLEYAATDIVLSELALPDFPRDRMRQHLLDLFALTVFRDAEPTLRLLDQRGLALGVVSNYNALLSAHLADLGLADWFSVMVNSADFGEQKPHPGIYHAAIEELKVSADRVLYVGDDVDNDYFGARQAGLQAVWLNRDGAPATEGVREIQALTEIPGLLDRHYA